MTVDLSPAQAARLAQIEAAPYAEEALQSRIARAAHAAACNCGDEDVTGSTYWQQIAVAAVGVMRGAADDGPIGRVLAVCDDLDREGVTQTFHGPENENQDITDRVRAAVGAPAAAEDGER